MVKRARAQDDDSTKLLLIDPATHRVVRLRARVIVNRALEMAERVADPGADVPDQDRKDCIARLAKMYAAAIGFTAKQAARMTLVDALEAVSTRERRTETDIRAEIGRLGPDAYKDPESIIRGILKDEESGGRLDVQGVVSYFERSFPYWATLPDGSMPLYKHRSLVVAALAAVKRTAGRTAGESKTGESKKWKPVADLIDAIGLGPIKPGVLPVEWSRWNRATKASAEAIQGKRRGRPRKN